MIASLLLISIYIGFRFEWKFAVPVLIALAHDLLITAGVYALFEREVTTATVAALLTIMGYSLYDTVIVFDRIRENVPRMPRATFSQIANRSMSEVFTRSLATSFAVLLPVGSLLLFGGETLKDFAFALLVGVLSGAYSSIFIATPVLVEWKEREPTYMRRRRLMLQEYGGHIPAFADRRAGRAGAGGGSRGRSRRGGGGRRPASPRPRPRPRGRSARAPAAPAAASAARPPPAAAAAARPARRPTAQRPPAAGRDRAAPPAGDGAPPPGDGAPPPADAAPRRRPSARRSPRRRRPPRRPLRAAPSSPPSKPQAEVEAPATRKKHGRR